jgi:hypothetical protein
MRHCIGRVANVLLAAVLAACSSGGDAPPAPPTNGGSAQAEIGPAGGTLTSEDGNASVVIPPGALATTTTLTCAATSPAPDGAVSVYEFGPAGLRFAGEVTITIRYDEAGLPAGLPESALRLATVVNGFTWQEVAWSAVDADADTVTGAIRHFSIFGAKPAAYVATLESAQVLPPGSSSALGKATFTIDTARNRLSYTIAINNLEGVEQSAQIHGPAARGAAAAALHTLPAGNPKAGIWQYSESIEPDLLAGRTYVEIVTDAHPGGELRGQIEPGPGQPASPTLTLTLARWDGATVVPAAVDRVEFAISAPGMATITRTVAPGATPVSESFPTPHGAVRRIEARAYSATDVELFVAVAYVDLGQVDRTILLPMIGAADTVAPTGAGAVDATAVSGRTIAVSWNKATDDTSPPEYLTYLIYAAAGAGGQDFTAPTAVSEPGALARTLTGLAAGTAHHFVVRAMDQAGNVDANVVEVSATTLAAGTGLFVDVDNGSDGPTCGTAANPCKTITAALARTAGDEPVYVAAGVYDETAGEVFPLALKAGTRLICETEWIGDPPGTRNTAVFVHKVLIRTTGLTSVLLGAPDAMVSGPIVELDPPTNSAGTGIDWNDSPIDIFYAWVRGPGDGTTQVQGIRIGGDSLVDSCKVIDFDGTAGRAISVWGAGNVIRHSLIRNSQFGISGQGDQIIHHCIIEQCQFAVGELGGEFYLNTVRDNYQGIKHPAPGARLVGNVIGDNDKTGIRLWHPDDTADPVVILGNWIFRNSIGIEVTYHAGAIIRYNAILCNSAIDLGTTSDVLLDCRNNAWDHRPPTTMIPTGEYLVGCDPGIDVCYALDYAGSPLPHLEPSYKEYCPLIGIVP